MRVERRPADSGFYAEVADGNAAESIRFKQGDECVFKLAERILRPCVILCVHSVKNSFQ